MRPPRLKQPLFQGEEPDDRQKLRGYRPEILGYDSIWNLLYTPSDMAIEDRLHNAEVALECLGAMLEDQLGEEIFDLETREPQLSFELEADT